MQISEAAGCCFSLSVDMYSSSLRQGSLAREPLPGISQHAKTAGALVDLRVFRIWGDSIPWWGHNLSSINPKCCFFTRCLGLLMMKFCQPRRSVESVERHQNQQNNRDILSIHEYLGTNQITISDEYSYSYNKH